MCVCVCVMHMCLFFSFQIFIDNQDHMNVHKHPNGVTITEKRSQESTSPLIRTTMPRVGRSTQEQTMKQLDSWPKSFMKNRYIKGTGQCTGSPRWSEREIQTQISDPQIGLYSHLSECQKYLKDKGKERGGRDREGWERVMGWGDQMGRKRAERWERGKRERR